MNETKINKITSELRAVADVDFMDVSFIAESVREDLEIKNEEDVRFYTLNVIGRLMRMHVFPGDYDHAATISFWSGAENELAKRIEAEWIAMGHTPTLEHPICWFGLKKPDLA